MSRKESHNPVVTEQPEDLPSTSEIGSQVQESSASGLGSQTQESGSCSESDSSFDPDGALLKDPDAMIEEFAADWVAILPRDDLYTLSLLLFHILQQEFQQLIYPASEIIGRVLNKNYKTIQKWRVGFIHNEGVCSWQVRQNAGCLKQ